MRRQRAKDGIPFFKKYVLKTENVDKKFGNIIFCFTDYK